MKINVVATHSICCSLLVAGFCLASQQARAAESDEAVEHFRAGQRDMQAGRFDAAIDEFKETLQLRPDLAEARVNLGLAYHAAGDYRAAVSELAQAVKERPSLLPASLFLGLSYLKLGLPEKAIPSLRHALSIDASNREAGRALATAELAEGDYKDAASQFRSLSRTDPDQADAWFALGQNYLEMAKRLAARISTEFRTSAWSYRLAGDVLAERKLWNDAAAAYRKALAADPGEPGLHAALADVLRQQGKAAEAQDELAREQSTAATRANSAPTRAACDEHRDQACAEFLRMEKQAPWRDRLLLGQTLLAMGRARGASDIFASALGQNPNNPAIVYWLSRSYLALADDCFNRLTAAYPDSWRAHELRAEGLHLRQADDDAIAEYREAERLRPDDAGIHEALGEILLTQHSTDEARRQLERALQLNPSAPRSLYLMGSLYVEDREPAQGIPYLETALRYDPTLIEARSVLGKAYLRVGKPQLAAAQLEQSTGIDRYGDLHYLLYEAYRNEGKPELAAKALARSQELRRKSAADDQAKIGTTDE